MKKLEEMQRDILGLSHLIGGMESEIDRLRNIVYRYHLKYGNSIQGGDIKVEDEMSFILDWKGDDMKCDLLDEREIGLISNYQNIKKQINSLNN